MNRQQKETLVDTLKKSFAEAEATYLIGCRGLSVNVMQDLRGKLRDKGARFKVAKMRLVKRAAAETPGLQAMAPFLHEQRGIIFVEKEPTAVAKALCDFAKEHEQLTIIVGYVDQEILDANTVKFLASLPSRDVLRAQLLGTMQAPITQCVGLLNLMIVRLLAT